MARAVGLDIGSGYLKLAELTGSAKGFKVHRLLLRPVPAGAAEESDAALAELIRTLFHEARLPKDDVCVSFPAGTTVLREITVPFHGDDQIEKVVRFEAENHLHGRAIEDVVVNWIKTGTTREGSQILVFASPKAELARRLAVVRAAGIEPASIDLDATALYAACHAAGVFRDHPNVAVVEIGARTSNVLLVEGGNLRVVRSILAGVESVGAAVGSDLNLPAPEAAARALRPRGPDPEALLVPAAEAQDAGPAEAKSLAALEGDVVEGRQGEFARKLQRELMRSLTAARGETPPEKILLTGGGSLLPGVPESLAARFGLPVEPLDLLGRLKFRGGGGSDPPELLSAAGAVAVGCGARILGVDPLGIELRRDEFAPTNKFDVVKGALAVVVTLLFCVLLALAYGAKERATAEKRAFEAVLVKAKTIYVEAEQKYQKSVLGKDDGQAKQEADRAAATLPRDHTALAAVKARLTQRNRRLQGELGLSKDIPRIQSALEVWSEIYAAINTIDRRSLGWFRINKLTVTQTSASMQIEAEGAAAVDKVETALLASPYLKKRMKDVRKPIRGATNPVRNVNRLQANFEWQFGEES